MNSVITRKLCLPQGQLQLKCNLRCRNTEWQVFCSLATFCSDYWSALEISNIRARFCTVPNRRVWLPAPACVVVAVRLSKALKTSSQKGQAICTSVRPTSTKDCTSGNETRTQNACASVPIRIVSYSYTVIVPCTVLYDVPINVAYKTLTKYFIQVSSFVTLVHITQTATRVGPNFILHSRN